MPASPKSRSNLAIVRRLEHHPEIEGAETIPESALAKLHGKVDRFTDPDGCWPYQFKAVRGVPDDDVRYGFIQWRDEDGRVRAIPAHRLALIEAVGPLAADIQACHACNNPNCCRVGPGHVYAGSAADNAADKARFHRLLELVDRRRGQWGCKLTEVEVRGIRRRADAGHRVKDIAAEFGVCPDTVFSVASRKSWRWLDPVEENLTERAV